MKRKCMRILTSVGFAAILCDPSLALAQNLGTAGEYGVLAGATVTNTGPTTITGALGLYPGTSIPGAAGITLFGPLHQTDAAADQAQTDLTTAFNSLGAPTTTCGTDLGIPLVELGGSTLTPGVYCMGSAAITGTLTLNAVGDPSAVWIFQIASSLTTATDSAVSMINSGNACNVYWRVGTAATLGTRTGFRGNILTGSESITLNTGATVQGRLLAQRVGAVTLDTNTINASTCGADVTATATPVPTLPKWAIVALMALLATGGFLAMRRRTV